jgi:RHS repeat-associated protein
MAYDGDNSFADFNSGGTLTMRYLTGNAIDQLFARRDGSGNNAWYLTDMLGSVRQVAQTNGTVLDALTFDSYGNILTETNSGNGDRFKFTAREWDGEIGLQFSRARYYDPGLGRWINQDPARFKAGDPNLYRYVHNMPISVTDSSGMGPPCNQLLAYMRGMAWGGMSAYLGYVAMTTVTTMLFPPAALVWSGVMLGAVIGGWLSVNLGNCDPVQEMLVAMPGGAIGVYVIEGGAIRLATSFPAWWQNVWAAGKEFLTQGVQRLSDPGPVDQYAGTGGSAAFGRLVQWGTGAEQAIDRTASITLPQIEKAGITLPVAQWWLDFYQRAVSNADGGQTAIERVKLMQRIIELLTSRGTPNQG